ncbi:hypothetical protein DQE80_16580, partial [Enterococcus sp. HPCN18]
GALRLILQPAGEAGFGDAVQDAGGLAAIGDEQSGKVGHDRLLEGLGAGVSFPRSGRLSSFGRGRDASVETSHPASRLRSRQAR